MKKIILPLLCLVLFLPGFSQGTLTISGGFLTTRGKPCLVLQNTNWENDGNFIADSSIVILEGNTHSVIGGDSATSFWTMRLNKDTAQVSLASPVEINDTLHFQTGLLNLNGQTLTLDTLRGGLFGESASTRMIGPLGGEAVKVINLTGASAVNPGNLGIQITTSGNPGLTTVKRGHVPESVGGTVSIRRYFELIPTQNGGLNATIRMNYFDPELNGLDENNLELFSGNIGGGGMNPSGFATRDGANNFVEQSGLDSFSRWTLSTEGSSFPVEWLGFDAWPVDGQVQTQWITATELQTHYYEVQRSREGEHFENIGQVPAAGNSQEILTYEFLDPQPFLGRSHYRIMQVDLDGTFEYSSVVSVLLTANGSLSMFPNPASEQLFLDYESLTSGAAEVWISDLRGRRLLTQMHNLDAGSHRLHLDVSSLASGVYTVQLMQGDEMYTLRLMVD